MGKTRGIATQLGRKKICSEPFAYGKRNCVAECDTTLEQFCENELTSAYEEKCSIVPCMLCPLIPQPPQVCMARGQQGINGWWLETSSEKILWGLKECMQSLAHHCLLSFQASRTTTLQVLSLSDGSMENCECVPTSVLLAHAFASLDIGAFPSGLKCIKIFGADVKNPCVLCSASWLDLPPWLDLQHVCLHNKKYFTPQLHMCGLCAKFDIVLMRQGLCYCQDQSRFCRPPQKLNLVGIKGEENSDGPSGTYFLEPDFRNERPCYRNGKFLMHWRPNNCDWVVMEDNETGYVWANVCKDTGSPAVANASWWVWNGKDFVIDADIMCDVAGSCPWKRPPCACECCAGISLDAAAVRSFIARVADVLDKDNPGSFALLHGGHYQGVAEEVKEFHLELERAAEQFNSSKSCIHAIVLKRQESQDSEYDCTHFWNQINGLLLSANLADITAPSETCYSHDSEFDQTQLLEPD